MQLTLLVIEEIQSFEQIQTIQFSKAWAKKKHPCWLVTAKNNLRTKEFSIPSIEKI